MAEERTRCTWAAGDWLKPYHDTEWGVPVFDDRKMFEFLVLDGFQAGLSWEIILKKRAGFEAAFAGYDPEKVAAFGPEEVDRLRGDASIVRNKAKIKATITNAQKVLDLWAAGIGLADFIWGFVDGRTIQNHWLKDSDIPAKTEISEKMSRELKARGFKFVGPTIIYAVMQSAGLVNDHRVDCFRYKELAG
jgi:DNA-3-methyladenine glycosylase I